MNKINYFYTSNGNTVPTPAISILNNHMDTLNITTITCFILKDKPLYYSYEIYVNNFLFVSRSPLPPYENYNVMSQSVVNMTSNFSFKDVYPNTLYDFEIRLFDNFGNLLDTAATTVFLVGGR